MVGPSSKSKDGENQRHQSIRDLSFHPGAGQNEGQTNDQHRSRCGDGNLFRSFFLEGGVKRPDFRDLLLFVRGVGRMQNGGDAQKA